VIDRDSVTRKGGRATFFHKLINFSRGERASSLLPEKNVVEVERETLTVASMHAILRNNVIDIFLERSTHVFSHARRIFG